MKKTCLAAFALLGAAAFGLNWDNALIMGTTPGGKMFYAPSEEMVFTLKLEGMKEPLPADTYFVDWERRGDDGLKERGRAPLPFPPEGLVLKTKSDKPGFVCIEANVVTKDGKRVPKNHRWEKRVFFQGGAGVQPELIPMADEPADYDAFWAACLKELAAVPMDAQMTPVECSDKEVRLYAVRIPCAGPWPVTGYLTIPVKASKTNRMPITASYRGASQDEQLAPKSGPHDRISMLINPNGYELGRGPEYVKQFFKDVSEPGYGYGMGPKSNEKKETSYWKWCALRAIRYLQWIKTLPEWDGKELVLGGGSQGDWQCYHAAAHVPGVTRINANGSWGCDWTGQNQFKRLRSTYRPGCWYPDMAYFDPVFAAKRITCPVNISFSGLGDYCSTPASLTLVYRNLKGPKKITYVQGSTHGWRPAGTQKFTVDGGFDAATSARLDPIGYIRGELAAGSKSITIPKARYWLTPAPGETCYLTLTNLMGVTIDCEGSEFVGTVKTTMFALHACTNVTLRNVSVDYADLPFTQAVIEKLDKDGGWDVRVIPGYPCPAAHALSADDIWPVQAYDAKTLELKNPMRFRDNIAIVRTGTDTYRITGGQNRKGDVGDIAVWSIRETMRPSRRGAVTADFCAGCTFENVTVYATPHGCGFAESSANGNRYLGCALVRRPPETDLFPRALKRLRSGNHDAFNSRCSYVGPTLDSCTFQYHCDDCVNISGFYAFVTEQKGRTLRIAPYGGNLRIEPGDTCQLMTFDGACLPDAKIVSLQAAGATTAAEQKMFESYNLWLGIAAGVQRAFTAELDADRVLPPGSVIISNRRMGNGFRIRNCTMGHNRARGLLIKASDGVIENNLIERVEGWAVQIAPEYEWMEGGCSKDMVVKGNVFRDNGGGVLLAGNNGARKPLPADSHRNVAITGNAISGSVNGIVVVGCTGLDVRGNAINLPDHPKARAVTLTNVSDVQTDALSSEWKAYLSVPAGYVFERRTERVQTWDFPEFTVESYRQANGPGTEQRVFLAVPKGRKGRLPAVAVPFYYPEAMLGSDPATGEELPKFKGVTMLADLARRGFVAATADAYHLTYRPGDGESRDDFRRWAKAAEALARDWPCWTGIGKLTADTRLVIDLLAADPRVDAARIGIIGHSLGGKMAFYAGCLDPRVKVVVTSDWGIDWDRTNWKDTWYWGAARVVAMKAAGRTHADLLSYAGGKPFMLIAGKYDNAASARAVLDAVPSCRDPERCVILDHASGHRPPPDALEAGYRFLDKFLKPNANNKETK